ncbi:MAG: DUF1080 domain-containing protein [Phycisphaeraceae bacterium]|nr:DUF1080 domain-containing protein [Phycisphaeraceae bacterium]
MKTTTLAITLCLTMGLFATLATADHHGKKKDKGDDGWASLMPEDSLDGWTNDNKKKPDHWKLEDGVIIGENPGKKGSVLWTDAGFGDYELVADYKTPSKDYDSGIFLRGQSHQVQIGVSRSLKKDLTGALYCPKDKNGSYPQQPDDTIKKAHKLGQWNTLRVVTKGKNIKTYLNGELINDYDGVTYPEKGKIGLQLHGGVHMKMQFKNIKIKAIED